MSNGNQNPPGAPPGPQGPGMGLHFIKALGHAALAWGHMAFAEEPDDDEEEEPRRPKTRIKRRGTSRPPARGSCCLGKRR